MQGLRKKTTQSIIAEVVQFGGEIENNMAQIERTIGTFTLLPLDIIKDGTPLI